jgi:HK97 family phage major capsid protein
MNKALLTYLVENHELDSEADEKAARELASKLLKSGELDPAKYADLLDETPAKKTPQEAMADMLAQNASQTAKAVADALSPFLKIISEDKSKKDAESQKREQETLEQMEAKVIEKLQREEFKLGGDGAQLMKMAREFKDESDDFVRVKAHVERFADTKTAMIHKGAISKQLKIDGLPIKIGSDPMSSPNEGGVEVNQPTERTRYMSAVVLKAQIAPALLHEHDWEVLRWIAHKCPFHIPGQTQSRMLSESERHGWLSGLKDFYTKADLLDDSTSGGEYSVPEFFDMDMIVAPTLADESIASFCNVVPIPRGSSVDNFTLGLPTISSETEGTAVTLFDATGFVGNHDTDIFWEAGFMKIGRHYLADAHPGLAMEIQAQYQRAAQLRTHRNITVGNGTTEMLGILETALVTDVPSANAGTGGAPTIADALNLLFAVSKPYRQRGGRMNAVYIGTEASYRRMRSIATGVTGDTRLIFGMNIEDYELFGHPFLLEEDGLDDHQLIFAQLKGYRIYLRQGVRFVREDRGDTLVRANQVLVGADMRTGGQLDLPGYAAVMDDFHNDLP